MSTSVKRMSTFINKKNQIKIEIIFYLLQKSEEKKNQKEININKMAGLRINSFFV